MPNINKNIIMQAGAAVANATNKAAGLSAATPEPGTIISVSQLVNGGRTVGPAALAHFTESVRNKLLSLLVSMEPIQDFNGYGHPWPAGGGANIWGGLVMANDIATATGVTIDQQAETVSITNTGSEEKLTGDLQFKENTQYTFILEGSGAQYANLMFTYTDGTTDRTLGRYIQVGANVSAPGKTVASLYKRNYTGTTVINYEQSGLFEGIISADQFSPYENICPISGRTGLAVYAGPTSAIGDAATYSMDWTSPAGTVYAGSADIVTGDIKAAPYYASYNGETLVGPWVSSMDVYDPEGTPTTGAQVVDLGGTMTQYHITGQDIITLVGDNYIWSDSGDVTITE